MRGTKGQFVISRATALEKSCSALAVATLLGFFQSFGQGGHDFEDVADDAVIGDFEDGRVGILVDGDDGARALHADHMLNGDRKSTRLNSSHRCISYAVFCLKKKKTITHFINREAVTAR